MVVLGGVFRRKLARIQLKISASNTSLNLGLTGVYGIYYWSHTVNFNFRYRAHFPRFDHQWSIAPRTSSRWGTDLPPFPPPAACAKHPTWLVLALGPRGPSPLICTCACKPPHRVFRSQKYGHSPVDPCCGGGRSHGGDCLPRDGPGHAPLQRFPGGERIARRAPRAHGRCAQ